MKRLVNFFMPIAVFAMVFSGCSKPEFDNPANVGTTTAYFGADAIAHTKVSLTPSSEGFTSSWVDRDQIGINWDYTCCDENDTEVTQSGSNVVGTWNGSKFEASLPDVTADWIYQACYPYTVVDPQKYGCYVDFGKDRKQSGNKFNGKYDIMLSDVVVAENSKPGMDGENNIVFQMERQTALAYFHLTSNLNEPVESATLSIDGDCIATENAILTPTQFAPANDDLNGYRDITITFEAGTAPSATSFDLWFNVLPAGYEKMSLTVKTTNHTMTISRNAPEIDTYEAGKLYVVSKTISDEKWNQLGQSSVVVERTIASLAEENNWIYSSNNNGVLEKINSFNLDNVITVSASYDATSQVTAGYNGNTNRGAIPYWLVAQSDNGVATISAKEGYKIVEVVITYTSNNEGVLLCNATQYPSPASLSIASDGVGSISFSALSTKSGAVNGQVRVNAIKVKYVREDGGSIEVEPQLEVSDASFASNTKNNREISVTSNVPWSVSIKSDELGLIDGIPSVVYADNNHADSNYNGVIRFSYLSENYSVFEDQVFQLAVSVPGHDDLNKDITVTHDKRGAKLFLNTDASVTTDTDVLTGSVEAASTMFVFYVIRSNFNWNILGLDVDGTSYDMSSLPSGYDVELRDVVNNDETHSYTGAICVSFPSNSASTETTYDRNIAIKVGDTRLSASENKTFTIKQAGETYIDPNARYYEKVISDPSILNGKYILAYGTTAYNAIGTDRLIAAEGNLAISEDKILSTDATDALAIDIYGTQSDYYMLFPDENFLSVINENSAKPSSSVFKLNSFTVSEGKVSIKGNDGTQDRILVNNGGKIAFYKSVSTYTLPTLYRLQGSENEVTEFKQFNVSCENENGTIPAAGGTKTITLTCPNVAWTVSQTGGATLSSTSGTGTGTITVTFPENTSETETREYKVTVATTDAGVPSKQRSKTFSFSQSKKSSSTVKVGDVMWSETWTGAAFGTAAGDDFTPSANYGIGTSVYNDASVSYTQSANSVYIRNEKVGGGASAPELMISKNQSWTVSGIPTGGAAKVVLTFKSNRTDGTVSCGNTGVTSSGSWNNKSFTFTTNGASTIDLTFRAPSGNNVRIDDIMVKVDTL